jgi:hypothetical protein
VQVVLVPLVDLEGHVVLGVDSIDFALR